MALTIRNYPNQSPKFFDSFLLKDLLTLPQSPAYKNGSSFPAVNIKESEKYFEVEIAAPGLKKEDFNVLTEKNVLIISAKPEEQKKESREGERYSLKEFSFNSFERRFSFPEDKIDTEKTEGNYENGVLRLLLHKKAEKTEKVKKIEIQ